MKTDVCDMQRIANGPCSWNLTSGQWRATLRITFCDLMTTQPPTLSGMATAYGLCAVADCDWTKWWYVCMLQRGSIIVRWRGQWMAA